MALVVICPNCAVRLTLTDDRAGTTFDCPKCHVAITVPLLDPAPAPLPPPPSAPASDEDDTNLNRHSTGRWCEDCGVVVDEDNYGGWWDFGGGPASEPRRFYYCGVCYKELWEAARAKRRWELLVRLLYGFVFAVVAAILFQSVACFPAALMLFFAAWFFFYLMDWW